MVVRRSRLRLQVRRRGPRRDVPDAGHQPSDPGDAHRVRLLAQRQGLHPHRHAEHRPDRAGHCGMAQRRPQERGPHQRVHGRRIRQQGHRGHLARHPRAALEEGERAGDDADHPRGGDLHRTGPAEPGGPDESRVLQRGADHGARHVRRREQRPLRATGRRRELGRRHLAPVSAAGHALARRGRADEHAAAQRTERAWRHAGNRHPRADHGQSGTDPGNRSGRDPLDELRRRKIAFRPPAAGRATPFDQRVREGSAGPRRGPVQVAGPARRQKRVGSKVRGVGVALGCFHAGMTGFDGLLVIRPDGRVSFQSGIGNLGTESEFDVHRAGAEVLGVPWEKCEVVWGNTSKNLPWTSPQGGSQTTYAMTRAAHATAMDARRKLQEIAAKTHGGSPEEYEVAIERVVHKAKGASMTFAEAARRAIELGGKYDGHQAATDLNSFTKASVAGLAGQGLVAAAKDKYPADGVAFSYVASFAEVEIDLETGKYSLVDYLCCADVGTVIHPAALGGQILGRSTLGFGHALGQKWVYDPQYGVMVSTRFYQNKPPTILDVPVDMQWEALNIPDPETPIGARGIGEPPVGGACASVLNALSDALGDEIFRRAPVNLDTILTSLEAGRPMQHPLTAHI